LEEMHAHRTPFYHAEKSFQSVGEFDDRFPVTQWVRVRFAGNKDHLWVRAGQVMLAWLRSAGQTGFSR
jgi:hypothetical protein